MFNEIVVATDLSAASEDVLLCVRGLKELGTKKAILVYAANAQYVETLEHDTTCKPHLNRQKARLEAEGFEVEAVLAPSTPALEISRIANEAKVSLIVVGVQSTSLAREMFAGEPLMGIVRHTTTPVLVMQPRAVKSNDTARYLAACGDLRRHILYCTDFSDTAERAFLWVQQFTQNGARTVTLLHVQDSRRIGKEPPGRLDEVNRIDEERLGGPKTRLQKDAGVDVQVRLSHGHPAPEILQAAQDEKDVSLIIVGSQGRGFLQEVFVGSISHEIVRNAPVPVLLVPALR